MTPTTPMPDDRLTGRALDMLRGEVADRPGLAEDGTAFAATVDEVVGRVGAGPSERDRLREVLLATRSQIAEGGS